jgi:hypothetical protein
VTMKVTLTFSLVVVWCHIVRHKQNKIHQGSDKKMHSSADWQIN